MKSLFLRAFLPFFSTLLGAHVWASPVEVLTQSCVQCHGANGVSTIAKTPHLNGQLIDYLEEDISALAQGSRQSDIPNHVPKTLTRQDIVLIARFYAESQGIRPMQTTAPEKVASGRPLYQKRCAECHPDNGRQSEHDAPFMAAQNLDYLIEQTQAFVSGKRKFVFMMDDAFRGLSGPELESIAHFFASQDQSKK